MAGGQKKLRSKRAASNDQAPTCALDGAFSFMTVTRVQTDFLLRYGLIQIEEAVSFPQPKSHMHSIDATLKETETFNS